MVIRGLVIIGIMSLTGCGVEQGNLTAMSTPKEAYDHIEKQVANGYEYLQEQGQSAYDHSENEVNNCFMEDGCSPRGKEGKAGVSGSDGDDGEPGATGPAGPEGQPGADGSDGEDGEIGPIGPEGPQGEKGPKGNKGNKGNKGDQGPAGSDGEDGQSCELVETAIDCRDYGHYQKVKFSISVECGEDSHELDQYWEWMSQAEYDEYCPLED